MKKLLFLLLSLLPVLSCTTANNSMLTPELRISENQRFLVTESGDPFFWLGDTGWLLFTKLSREEAAEYFENRVQNGFNVIQVMVLHNIKAAVNVYGDSALINQDIAQPLTTEGNSFEDPLEYDYWDHIDYLVSLAQEKGLYLALVPIWGSNVRNGSISSGKAGKYASWLAERYKGMTNIIWLNGGDTKGGENTEVWNTIGSTIRKTCPGQLITFHPFGRTQSSEWFHNETWLDFNMFQSGHRNYAQDTEGLRYGEDNWKYASVDYNKTPIKPTIDGEPSYEGIPQGLHDTSQPYWTGSDVRRYAYWSVFAGCFGFTYGHSAIMQFHRETDTGGSYGVKETWEEALNAPGASQMKYLKQLMLSKSDPDRKPAQDLIAGNQGEKYDYLAAVKGTNYAFVYTCNGNSMNIDMAQLPMKKITASWYNPRNGEYTKIGNFEAKGLETFDPPGEKENGNDWILVLD